jgi:beta-lactamase regulating signal transducer with metallopeptidase domain
MDAMTSFLNLAGESFFGFAGEMLIQSSVLIIVLLLLDLVLRKRVRAVFRYWMWMLVLVKMFLPTTLSLPTGFGYWVGGSLDEASVEETLPGIGGEIASYIIEPEGVLTGTEYTAEQTGVEGTTLQPTPPLNPVPVAASPELVISRRGLLFGIWLAVVTAMILLLMQRMGLVQGLIRQSKEADDELAELFEQCRRKMRMGNGINLRLSAVGGSPSVCGLFRPTILIPEDMARQLERQELKAVLLHELTHVRRGDLWVSLVQTVSQITYFYNPMLWIANAVIRQVRERAVDEGVIVAMGEQAEAYPATLLSISKLAFSRPALSLHCI